MAVMLPLIGVKVSIFTDGKVCADIAFGWDGRLPVCIIVPFPVPVHIRLSASISGGTSAKGVVSIIVTLVAVFLSAVISVVVPVLNVGVSVISVALILFTAERGAAVSTKRVLPAVVIIVAFPAAWGQVSVVVVVSVVALEAVSAVKVVCVIVRGWFSVVSDAVE